MFSCFLDNMAKNEKQEWITTKIPKDIADEIEILIKNKKLGYNSKTGFVSDALREKIDQLSGKSKKQQTKLEDKMNEMQQDFNARLEMIAVRLESVNEKIKTRRLVPFTPPNIPKIELIVKEKDCLVLMDHTKERIVDVVTTNGEYFCNLCKEKDCVHIGFIFSLPDVHKKLGKKLTKTV
jgi:hypothetical protein